MNLLKIKIRKEHEKYFVVHQKFSKVFHGPSISLPRPLQKPSGPPPTYLMYGP